MSERILIVEDDPSLAELERVILETEGYEVIVARDGLEGLLKLSIEKPSLVLLDIMMPDVDGDRLLMQMFEEPRFAGVPVVIVTGVAHAHRRFDDVVGPDNVITKPFEPSKLLARVRALVEGGGRDRA